MVAVLGCLIAIQGDATPAYLPSPARNTYGGAGAAVRCCLMLTLPPALLLMVTLLPLWLRHRFEANGDISGMCSVEGELVPLKTRIKPAEANGAVEKWLVQVGDQGRCDTSFCHCDRHAGTM